MSEPMRSASALALALLVSFFNSDSARSEGQPQGHSHVSRAGSHAPIGVMGDHPHKKGEIMLSYRYNRMRMDGNRDGTRSLTTAQALAAGPYAVVPTDMDTNMHMFGMMYAPADWVTLMAMVPYIDKSMDHQTGGGALFETNASGVGDFKLSALWPLLRNVKGHDFALQTGLSFPTGSIREKDFIPPAGAVQRLPYPMQLGTGTYDVTLGGTYMGYKGAASWGGQVLGVIRPGENDNNYTVGNRYHITGWFMWDWVRWMGTSLRLDWQQWMNYDGADPLLNPAIIPTADPKLRAGRQLDILVGANFALPFVTKWLRGQRLAIEAGFPLYRNLDGPQLERDWRVIVGWQKAFHLY